MAEIFTVASRQELTSKVSSYASKGFVKVHEDEGGGDAFPKEAV